MDTNAFYRDTWAEINLSAIKHNVSHMKDHIGQNVQLMAVVKANAYGHGDIEVTRAALKAGADLLAVAFLDEAISLRNKGVKAPILVLGAVPSEYVKVAVRYNVIMTAYSIDWLREVVKVMKGQMGQPIRFHLKIDSGMNRLGVKTIEQVSEVKELVHDHSFLQLEGVFTHFATADEKDENYFGMQVDTFKTLLQPLHTDKLLIHCANSAAGLRFKDTLFNMVRFGISMYGLSPSEEIKDELPFQLEEALSLHTKLAHVKPIQKGESVSYGATYTANQDTWIGTIPIGYADGWIRKLAGTEVLVGGKRRKIAGRVCMDQFMVDLKKDIPAGEPVVLIGTQGEDKISVDEIAKRLETINYEVTCSVGYRVPRVYIEDGERVHVRNPLLQGGPSFL
ncbi:alanine racemase [Bacillus altitudinis]|uniref:alanine racemase n=1 Tax=Bacillus altitudinis TaxID=293387 RepID=UPI002282E0F4|nr:alanine racemase [Bacillus altitudinis]MCY7438807.1 alanine racemase [Bacillus altitudinis]MEC1144587.1 alanine racemase [Bacillus altitudinis]